jgi:predicted helicase
VKERLKAKKTLVLVPSLGLLSQILNEWTFAARKRFDALCVCSDQTVNRKEEDEAISLVSDLPFPVSSDVKEIAHFLKQDSDQVIFSTYQSSPLIAQAQKNRGVPHFDLIIADEAHRCAGKSDTVFGTVLDDGQIKSERRLFATATPRVYRTSLKKEAEEVGVEVVDMNDEKSFGKRFHTLTFGEAIKRDLLTDYRVLIVGVDNERIKEWIENRRLVATDTGLATDARSLAGQIGLLKAIKDWNLRRLISFHGRVKRAREFSEDIIQVGEWLDADHRPSHKLWAEYVSGEMPTIARRQKLKRLKNVGKDEIGILSNARCLSEGVDVPVLDGVSAFLYRPNAWKHGKCGGVSWKTSPENMAILTNAGSLRSHGSENRPLETRPTLVMLVGVRKNSFQKPRTSFILCFIQSKKTKSGQGVKCCRANWLTVALPLS